MPDEPDEKPEECELCQFRTEELTWSAGSDYGTPAMQQGHWLCSLCYGSLAGNALRYPQQYDRATLGVICYVGNAIIEAIREASRGGSHAAVP